MIEETTGLDAPRPPSITITAELPAPENRTDAHYFDLAGRPMCEETRLFLHNRFLKYLFVIDGRLRPEIRLPAEGASAMERNAYLRAIGLDMDAGLQPWERQWMTAKRWVNAQGPSNPEDEKNRLDDEDLERWKHWIGGIPDPLYARSRTRRSLFKLPRSDWRRVLVARLAVLFDGKPTDPLIQKLAEYLSRDQRWHEWWYDPELQPLHAQAFNNKERWALLRAIEGMAFRRANWVQDRRGARTPSRMSFSTASGTYVFALPRRPRQGYGRMAGCLNSLVLAAHWKIVTQRRMDARIVAATVWKAGRILEEPASLRRERLTLRRVAAHFGLTARQVRYAAEKLRPEVERLLQALPSLRSSPSA